MKSNNFRAALVVAFILVISICTGNCKPLKSTKNEQKDSKEATVQETYKFLTKYGYMDEKQGLQKRFFKGASLTDFSKNSINIQNAIKKMQKEGGLRQTGTLNNETVNLMNTPRCGVKDGQVKKRFNIISYPWGKRSITFYVANRVHQLSRDDIARSIQRALDAWGVHSGLKFKEVFHADADIIVSFARGYHGDGNPFDGPGSTLAHAYSPGPGIGGDVHFDADEPWSMEQSSRGGSVNFYHIALHELGHSLGLGHSEVPTAVMYAWYRGFGDNLAWDDINGIKRLYASNSNKARHIKKL